MYVCMYINVDINVYVCGVVNIVSNCMYVVCINVCICIHVMFEPSRASNNGIAVTVDPGRLI